MFDYLFNPDYKAAKNQYNSANNRRNKLQQIKNDITNDTSSISTINKRIDYIYDDFIKVVKVSDIQSRVSTKLGSLKETYQTFDSNLVSACDCIESERSVLWRQMSNAENTMNSIKNQTNGSW